MDIPARLSARSGVLSISGGAVLWGTTGVVVHAVHARTGLSAVSISCYRVLVAAAVLTALRGADLLRLARRIGARRGGVLVLAGAALGISQALYFVAIADAGVSLATLICIGTTPVVLSIGTALTRRRLPSATMLATLACAVVGLALVSGSTGSASGGHPVAGVLAAVGSGLAYAAATALSGALAGSGDPLTLTCATSVVAALTLLPAALSSGMGFASDGRTISALLYLGVITSAVAYGLFFAGLRSTPAEVAAVLTLLEPLAATLLAAALLGETLTPAAAAGAALLLVAVTGLYVRPVLI